MHTLSIFPSLLTFGIFAPFLLRLAVAVFILSLGYDRYKKPMKWSSLAYLLIGGFIFLGLYTQIIAILAIGIIKFDMYLDYWKDRKIIPIPKNIYFLYGITGIILLSLLITGPGAIAIDYPL